MLGINVVVGETDAVAENLFSSHQQAFVNLRRGTPGPLPPPDHRFVDALPAHERRELDQTLSVTAVGSPAKVQTAIEAFIGRTQADELILVSQIYDHASRLRSYQLTADLRERIEMRLA
jgi:alkanesulfonate monooxygenase SsuD/methylene tetrahydromethanopterin reductase-like flavin-dependent oxidoreductase (luciferase family)